jgi:hypothetical protein
MGESRPDEAVPFTGGPGAGAREDAGRAGRTTFAATLVTGSVAGEPLTY